MTRELLDVAWKTLFYDLFLIALLRVTGKREIGTLGPVDLIAFIMLSEAAIISIADGKIPFLVGFTPVVILGGVELLLSYLGLKDKRVRTIVQGAPSILIAHGKLNQDNMRRLRYSLSDLMAEIRGKNLTDLADVEFAILETTGSLSVVPRPGARPVTPDDLQKLGITSQQPSSVLGKPQLPASVVLDGEVDEEALRRSGKDRAWLDQELKRLGAPPVDQLLVATVDAQGTLTAEPRQQPSPGQEQSGGEGDGSS